MSKKKTTSAAPEATAKAPQKKARYRVLSFFALALCAALLILPLSTFTSAWAITEQSLALDTLSALFAGENTAKVFGFLPAMFTGEGFMVTLAAIVLYVTVIFAVISAVLGIIGLLCGKKHVGRSALTFVIVAAIVYFAGVLIVSMMEMEETVIDLYSLIIAIVGLVIAFLALIIRKKEKKAVNPLEGFQKEEYVEAYEYDGGPVAGVELAEEVFPTVAAIEAVKDPDGTARNTVASLLGNGFDPFLITLTEKEKNEFIDLYVLKCRGIMPEIPGYVVGGDNKEFFNRVFIYLGQYREKIPGDLLAKMYQFSMKL